MGPKLGRLSSSSRILALGDYPRAGLKQMCFNSQISARDPSESTSVAMSLPNKVVGQWLHVSTIKYLFSDNQALDQTVPSGRESSNHPKK